MKLLLKKLSVMQDATLLIQCRWLKFLSLKCLCNQMNPSIYSVAPKLISYPYIYILMSDLHYVWLEIFQRTWEDERVDLLFWWIFTGSTILYFYYYYYYEIKCGYKKIP